MNYSRQRELIKNLVTDSRNHPTAQDIFERAREVDSNISLATVYRNLHQLVESGEIGVLSFAKDSERFDPILTEHFHFMCNECGSIIDLPISTNFEDMDKMIAENIGRNVTGHDLIVHGTCVKCINRNVIHMVV